MSSNELTNIDELLKRSVGYRDFFKPYQNQTTNYPPYNIIEDDEGQWHIELAVAGFSESEIEVTYVPEESILRVVGTQNQDTPEKYYVHKGIAGRSFERLFKIAEYVKIKEATIDNGILNISLYKEVPESARPHKIEVKSVGRQILMENK